MNWNGAQDYCEWLNRTYLEELPQGCIFRLAAEAEWEKAARGEFGNIWPWGNEWDSKRCNSSEAGSGSTSPVGAYSPHGDSPYGAADMAGNVWEWTNSLYKPYPYDFADGREDPKDTGTRVVRGGAFNNDRRFVRVGLPHLDHPGGLGSPQGLRVVVAHTSLLPVWNWNQGLPCRSGPFRALRQKC